MFVLELVFVLDGGINFVYTSARTIDSLDVSDDSTVADGVRRKNDAIDLKMVEQRDVGAEEMPFIASESIVVATCICSGCTTHITLIMSLIFRLMCALLSIQYKIAHKQKTFKRCTDR